MKKNANILKYMENYKKKYAINYAQEGSTLVKRLSILVSIVWCYSFFWMALSTLSWALNFKMNVVDFAQFKRVFLITAFCTAAMIAAAVLFFCKQKIIGLSLAIIAQPFILFTYKPMLVYGMGYRPKFYFAYSIPAVLMVIVCGILLFILIRAVYKTNQIYNYIVEELYKQYGTKNGEKLSDVEWQEFLDNYDPYKK